jgi:uncharacterized YigZ family protein
MQAYRTVMGAGTAEFVDRRSRFIGHIQPVSNEQQATAFIDDIRREYWDARHNVPAFIVRDGNIRRFSDDGEPQGTAGMPVLDVLQKQDLTDCVLVVTRYFGGILLGGGGLVRAYSHTAALTVENAGIAQMTPAFLQEISCSYTQYGWLLPLIESTGGQVLGTEYTELVTVKFLLDTTLQGFFEKQLTERSAGSLTPVILEEQYRKIPL